MARHKPLIEKSRSVEPLLDRIHNTRDSGIDTDNNTDRKINVWRAEEAQVSSISNPSAFLATLKAEMHQCTILHLYSMILE